MTTPDPETFIEQVTQLLEAAEAPKITEPGVYDDMPDAVYHADPVPGGSLSNTGAKILATKTPADFDYWRNSPPETKPAFDLGHAAHAEVLGRGLDVALIPGPWTTNAAKAKVAEAREAGQVPLKPEAWDTVEGMAAGLRANPLAMAALAATGKPEQSLFWRDTRTGIWRRARIDWLPTEPTASGQLVLVDYKTAANVDAYKWAKDAADFGYHQQADSYTEGARVLGLHPSPSFVFIVQQKTPPYPVRVFQLDDEAMQIGRLLNDRAMDVYVEHTTTGTWPAYPPVVERLALPTYYTRTFEETLS